MAHERSGPSRSPAFCILPWIHVEVVPEGAARLCCAARETLREDGVPMTVATHSIDQIRGSRDMRAARLGLASGARIAACGHCWEQESRGERSLRQHFNHEFAYAARRLDARVELGADAGDPMPLEYLQLSLGNRCNLACRMCNASYSSRIEADPVHVRWAPRLWTEVGPAATSVRPSKRQNWVAGVPWYEQAEFVARDLVDRGSSLKMLYVTGGEPLVTPSFHRILEEYVARGHAENIAIGLNTNLFQSEGRVDRAMRLFLKFQACRIVPSIDGHGEVYEYIRHPARWSVVDRNLRAIKARTLEHPRLTLLLTTVVQAYNCFNLVDLLRYADELSIECEPHVAVGPPQVTAQVLPPELRREAGSRLRSYAATSASSPTGARNRDHAVTVAGMLEAMQDPPDVASRRSAFSQFTRELDGSRNQSLARSVPELAGLL